MKNSKIRIVNVSFLKNEFRKQYASTFQNNRLIFPLRLDIQTLKSVGRRFFVSQIIFAILVMLAF